MNILLRNKLPIACVLVIFGFAALLYAGATMPLSLSFPLEVLWLCDIFWVVAAAANTRARVLNKFCFACYIVVAITFFWWIISIDALSRRDAGITILAFTLSWIKMPYDIALFRPDKLNITLAVLLTPIVLLLGLLLALDTNTDLLATITMGVNGYGTLLMTAWALLVSAGIYIHEFPTVLVARSR